MRAPWLRLVLALVLGVGLLLPLLAAAQDEDPLVVYKRTTRIDFEKGDVIEVDIVRPDTDLYKSRLPAGRQSLIRLRENWKNEVLASARGS
jgi:hypothetical protein